MMMNKQPSNAEILAELQMQRRLIEQLAKVVPGAVMSEETRREEREKEERLKRAIAHELD